MTPRGSLLLMTNDPGTLDCNLSMLQKMTGLSDLESWKVGKLENLGN
jgi:hypothetical protein